MLTLLAGCGGEGHRALAILLLFGKMKHGGHNHVQNFRPQQIHTFLQIIHNAGKMYLRQRAQSYQILLILILNYIQFMNN